jgi:hypothetical protein
MVNDRMLEANRIPAARPTCPICAVPYRLEFEVQHVGMCLFMLKLLCVVLLWLSLGALVVCVDLSVDQERREIGSMAFSYLVLTIVLGVATTSTVGQRVQTVLHIKRASAVAAAAATARMMRHRSPQRELAVDMARSCDVGGAGPSMVAGGGADVLALPRPQRSATAPALSFLPTAV